MKKPLVIGGLIAINTIISCTSVKDLPIAVNEAFARKFPNADNPKWDKENDDEWEAEFKLDGEEYSANFTNDGQWLETEHEVELSEVPQNIMAVLTDKYPDFKLKEIEISESAEGTFYEFEIKTNGSALEVAIDKTGKIAKTEEAEND